MNEYVITYELRNPSQSYEQLWTDLRSINAKRVMNSVWLLSSEYTVSEIYQKLKRNIDTNDKLLVVETSHLSASFSEHVFDAQIRLLEKKIHQLDKQLHSYA